MAYTFAADNFCDYCIIDQLPTGSGEAYDGWGLAAGGSFMEVEDNLNEIAAAFSIDRNNESSFDSDDFPKVLFHADDDQTCGACGEEL